MKKVFFLLLALVMCLSLCACGGSTGSPTGGTDATESSNTVDGDKDTIDIWSGVEGDNLEFAFTLEGYTMNVVLRRDGSCYTSMTMGSVVGENIGRPELDAEMKVFPTSYGAFEVKNGEITATLDAQTYYRFIATGKDADALKDAYFETNMRKEFKEGYYSDKGVILDENKGTIVLVCKSEGESYITESFTRYDENNVKTEGYVFNADGSYVKTLYYPDGTVEEIRNYDSDDHLIKEECYD